MASINFSDINTDSNNGEYKVGFFSLKNGEEAIVRFAINSIDVNNVILYIYCGN